MLIGVKHHFPEPAIFIFDDRDLRLYKVDGSEVELRPQVAEFLNTLMAAYPQSVSKSDLISAVWGETNVSDQSLSLCVSEIRKALADDPRKPTYIKTIPKRGYQWLCPTTQENTSQDQAPEPIISPSIQVPEPHKPRGWQRWLSAVLITILIASAVTWIQKQKSMPNEEAIEYDGSQLVAIMPFSNQTGDQSLDWTSIGLAEMVRGNFEQIEAIETVPLERILAAQTSLDQMPDLKQASAKQAMAWCDFMRCSAVAVTQLVTDDSGYVLESRLIMRSGSETTRVARGPSLMATTSDLSQQLIKRWVPTQPITEFVDEYSDDPHLNVTYATGIHKMALEGPREALPYFESCLDQNATFHWARFKLAKCLRLLGEPDLASEHVTHLLKEAKPGTELYAEALGLMSVLCFDQTQFEQSAEYVRRALDIYADLGAHLGMSICIGQLGYIEYARDNLADAAALLEACYQMVLTTGDRLTEANVVNNLAIIEWANGNIDKSLQYNEYALTVFNKYGSQPGVALMTGNIGAISMSAGRIEAARPYLIKGLDLYRQLGDEEGLNRALLNLSILKSYDQDLTASISFANEGLEISQKIGNTHMEIQFVYLLIKLTAGMGDFTEANNLIQTFQSKVSKMTELPDLQNLFTAAAVYAHIRQGHLDKAQASYATLSVDYLNQNVQGIFLRSLLAFSKRDQADAMAAIDTAIEVADGDWKSLLTSYRDAYQQQEMPQLAFVAYN